MATARAQNCFSLPSTTSEPEWLPSQSGYAHTEPLASRGKNGYAHTSPPCTPHAAPTHATATSTAIAPTQAAGTMVLECQVYLAPLGYTATPVTQEVLESNGGSLPLKAPLGYTAAAVTREGIPVPPPLFKIDREAAAVKCTPAHSRTPARPRHLTTTKLATINCALLQPLLTAPCTTDCWTPSRPRDLATKMATTSPCPLFRRRLRIACLYV